MTYWYSLTKELVFSPYDLLVFSDEGISIFAPNGCRFLPNYNDIDRNSVQV